MRSDLENNRSRGLKLISGKFATEVQALTGDVTLVEEGTLLHFLDANGADRTITLPAIKRGLFYIIANIGAANQLNIVDSGSNLITFLRPNESTWLFGADASWTALHAGAAAEVFGAAGVGHSIGLVPDPGAVSGLDRVLGDDGIWHTVGTPGFIDAYKRVSDGIHIAIASGLDQLRLRSSSGAVVPTVTDDDPTYGDVVDFTLDEANIDHDLLKNFVANKHIDHTSVSINPGSGLSGGGDISATRTLSFAPHSLTLITPELADEFPFYDVSGAVNGKATFTTLNGTLDHNALLNYAASRHIDHSAVSVAAGSGLSGGGTIDTTRTLSLDIHGLTADTLASADELPFYDASGADTNKITFANFNATLDHNSLLNYVANQHIDHTAVSVATAAGTSGLTGGGTIASTRNLSVDINGLTADASPDNTADYVMTYDASALGLKKVLLNKIAPTAAALTKADDTNVTLTLGGSPTTALLQATSITVGWTGLLAPSRGGTGISALGIGVATFLGTPSSANLAAALTDETGTGPAVFANAPALTSPTVTTQSARDNSTKAASTAYVDTATREKLSAPRTYYVRTDGNDSNTGLANTSGGAFLTGAKALSVVAGSIDFGGQDVTIQFADGTYTGTNNVTPWVGGGTLTMKGNSATPANCLISTTSADCFDVTTGPLPGTLTLDGFKLATTTSGFGIYVPTASLVKFKNIDFGAVATRHIQVGGGGTITYVGDYSISGSSPFHVIVASGGTFNNDGAHTVTLTGTPNFSSDFVLSTGCGFAYFNGTTFSGSATGTRYSATLNGAINTGGGGATFLPGNSAGSTATGGQYA